MNADDTIQALLIETKSGRRAVLAKVFIDCSGDGDIAAWSGAPYALGDETGATLYPTMMFRVNGVDATAAGEAWKTIDRRIGEAARQGIALPGRHAILRPQRNPVEWRVCATRVRNADGTAVNGTNADELSAGEIEGRRQTLAFFDFLRRDVPGFAEFPDRRYPDPARHP